MKESLLTHAAGHRIAVAVEHGEGLAMLEDAGVRLGQAGRRQQVIRSKVRWIQLGLALLSGLNDRLARRQVFSALRARRSIDRKHPGSFEPWWPPRSALERRPGMLGDRDPEPERR